jgi:NADH-quinone oxidoreductase subunit N
VKSLAIIQQDYLTGAFGLVIPEIVLVGVACALFLLGLFAPRRLPAVVLALAGVAGAAVAAALLGNSEVAAFWQPVEGTPFDPRAVVPFDPTGPAAFVRWLALGSAAVFLLLAWPEVRGDNAADYAGCTLVVAAGVSLVGRANDLISLFLALELVSIPTYVLLYLPVRTRPAQEAAVKYFLLSVLSSAMLLFGFSYLYGLTGTTNIGAAVQTLTEAHRQAISPLALVAILMAVVGLGFRVAAFPFHWYAPDVYEGAPTGVVAQISYFPKVVGFVALARLLGLLAPPIDRLPFDTVHTLIPLTLWIIAAATMTFGNVLALLQENLKRLLAYSGIAHGGYMLLGLVVALSLPEARGAEPSQTGLDALLFYLVAYGLMTVGAFAVLLHLSGTDGRAEAVDDLAGLGQTHPVSAAALGVMLLSLIGMPLTAGFAGKFLLFLSAFDAPAVGPMRNMYRILAVILAVNAAVGAVYYLRVLGVMYLRTPLRTGERSRGRPALVAALICAIATVVLGVYPKPLAEAARKAVPVADDRPRPAVASHPSRDR